MTENGEVLARVQHSCPGGDPRERMRGTRRDAPRGGAAERCHAAPQVGGRHLGRRHRRQFRDEVHALAKGFIAAGVEAGDRVALMSHTRYEWTLIDYALWTAGAVVVPIYETSSAEQAEWILANSEARAVIAETDGFAGLIGEARDRLPALEHLWLLESDLPALTAAGAGESDETLAARPAHAAPRTSPPSSTPRVPPGAPRGASSPTGTCSRPSGTLSWGRSPRSTPPEGLHAAVPAARARFRPGHRGRHPGGRHRARALQRHGRPAARPRVVPADVRARGAARVREGLQRRGGQGAGRGQGQDLRPRRADRRAYSHALDVPAARACACGPSTPCSTGSSTASSAPRSAAGPSGRSPAARRSRRGSGTSSAASVSPSSRGTG